jgi:hypothetical protein
VTDKDAQDQVALMGTLQRQAGQILALPPSERDARYDHYREAHTENALHEMKDRARAEEFAGKMDKWLRWIVGMTEGSARNGRAWGPNYSSRGGPSTAR